MIRSRRAAQVLLLTGIVASGAFAAPLACNINFTTTFGSPTPTGSFTDDSALVDGTQFSAFLVDWDGITFDFTSPANSGGTTKFGCVLSAGIVIFDMMSGVGQCPGTPSVLQWQATEVPIDNFGFEDAGNPASGHNINLFDNVVGPSGGALLVRSLGPHATRWEFGLRGHHQHARRVTQE
jgi:hypothetical protein